MREQLAREVLELSRNTLLANLHFLDIALSQLESTPIEQGTAMTDGAHRCLSFRSMDISAT